MKNSNIFYLKIFIVMNVDTLSTLTTTGGTGLATSRQGEAAEALAAAEKEREASTSSRAELVTAQNMHQV